MDATPKPPDIVESYDLDIKPDDHFPLEEKRRMRGHMERREWSQLGFIIVERVLVDWDVATEKEDFLQWFHALPGSFYERLEKDFGNSHVRELFQWADHFYAATRELAMLWRDTGRA